MRNGAKSKAGTEPIERVAAWVERTCVNEEDRVGINGTDRVGADGVEIVERVVEIEQAM